MAFLVKFQNYQNFVTFLKGEIVGIEAKQI